MGNFCYFNFVCASTSPRNTQSVWLVIFPFRLSHISLFFFFCAFFLLSHSKCGIFVVRMHVWMERHEKKACRVDSVLVFFGPSARESEKLIWICCIGVLMNRKLIAHFLDFWFLKLRQLSFWLHLRFNRSQRSVSLIISVDTNVMRRHRFRDEKSPANRWTTWHTSNRNMRTSPPTTVPCLGSISYRDDYLLTASIICSWQNKNKSLVGRSSRTLSIVRFEAHRRGLFTLKQTSADYDFCNGS